MTKNNKTHRRNGSSVAASEPMGGEKGKRVKLMAWNLSKDNDNNVNHSLVI